LSIQEVADGHRMAGISTIGSIAEHLLDVIALRSKAQILLAQGPGVILQIVLLLHSMSMMS
jgi:hypothetical protein